MSEKKPRPAGRHPLGPPLDPDGLRGFHRRLVRRPLAEQVSFLRRLNWNMLDEATGRCFVSWLAGLVEQSEPEARQAALDALAAWPRWRRARYRGQLERLVTGAEARRALGRVLGPGGGGGSGSASGAKAPKATPGDAEPPRAAGAEDLARLVAFFKKP